MSYLSSALDEALQPTTDFVRHDTGVLVEGSGDEWMEEAVRQFQIVAPKHAAWLKRQTGRGWKLFKHFLTENGRLLFRFDLARRQDMTQDPMIVVRMAYSASSDLYNVQIEVWRSVSEKIDSHETTDVDVEMLQDPERFYYRVEKGIAQLKPGSARTEEDNMANLSSDLLFALTETAPDVFDLDEDLTGTSLNERTVWTSKYSEGDDVEVLVPGDMNLRNRGWVRGKIEAFVGRGEVQYPRVAVNYTINTSKGEETKRTVVDIREAKAIRKRVVRVFDESRANLSVAAKTEARSNLQVDSGGGFSMEPRTNPTKTGPAAERAATLKTARMGIERMVQALNTVRGWIKDLGLTAEQDKSGAAAAALKMAADEIAKVEDVQGILSSIFELTGPSASDVAEAVEAVAKFIAEKRSDPTPEMAKAMEGLTRMVDGLRQLQGMLRQAKLSGRILGAVDAAIAGLKTTRDAIGAMTENIALDASNYPPSNTQFDRMKATEVRKGSWVKGGTSYEPIFRQVSKIERQEDDMAFVILHFEQPYTGSDGQRRSTARFHKDAVVTAAKG